MPSPPGARRHPEGKVDSTGTLYVHNYIIITLRDVTLVACGGPAGIQKALRIARGVTVFQAPCRYPRMQQPLQCGHVLLSQSCTRRGRRDVGQLGTHDEVSVIQVEASVARAREHALGVAVHHCLTDRELDRTLVVTPIG